SPWISYRQFHNDDEVSDLWIAWIPEQEEAQKADEDECDPCRRVPRRHQERPQRQGNQQDQRRRRSQLDRTGMGRLRGKRQQLGCGAQPYVVQPHRVVDWLNVLALLGVHSDPPAAGWQQDYDTPTQRVLEPLVAQNERAALPPHA